MDLLKSEIEKKRKVLFSKVALINKNLAGLTQLEASVEHYNECLLADLSVS